MSPDTASVSGRVLLDGKEVESGVISFIPDAGATGPSGGAAIVQGIYEVPLKQHLVKGEYRVEITVIPVRPSDMPAPPVGRTGTDLSVQRDTWGIANPVQYFKDASQSVVLNPGDNQYEIDLKPKKK